MVTEREKLIKHLSNIHAGGQIGEVVLKGAFEAAAVTVDQQLLVVAPPLSGVEPLPEDVGVVDLRLLISALKSKAAETGDVAVVFKDNRILVEEKHGGRVSLVTASPSRIVTNLADENKEKVLSAADGEGIALSQTIVKGVLETTGLLGADEITLVVSSDGSKFVVGHKQTHFAEFDFDVDEDAEYELLLDAKIVTSVFAQISDFTQSELVLTGEESVVAVKEGDYCYIISPQERGE